MAVIKALFLDVGGVLLTNGWDHNLRAQAATHFGADVQEVERRHALVFGTYETGRLSLETYLQKVFFYQTQSFSVEDMKQFIFNAVRPYPSVLEWVKQVKQTYGFKVVMVSNEGREIALDRIRRFDLTSLFDMFVVSAFVGIRKPDIEIYRLALDLAQVTPQQVIYIDDRPLLIESGQSLGLQGICHTNLSTTQERFAQILEIATPAKI